MDDYSKKDDHEATEFSPQPYLFLFFFKQNETTCKVEELNFSIFLNF